MNKVLKAMLAGLFAVMLLTTQISIAEEPMVVAGELAAAELPEDEEYAQAMEILEGILSGQEEPDAAEEPTAVPTAVPLPTETPAETESSYSVSFVLPNGWTNTAKGTVTIQITDNSGSGIQKIEYNFGGNWTDVTTEYFMSHDGKINATVTENGTITVRMTDPRGFMSEESKEIRVFDRTEPGIRAEIRGEMLHVQSWDDESEVAGVQVNGLLCTTVENGTLDIRIPDVLSKYKHLAVRAFDYAGNFSSPVTMDNPFYVEPTSSPQNTPSATQQVNPTTVPVTPTWAPTSMPYIPTADPTPQIIYIQPEATPTPVIEKEYIPIGPGMPYLADGNGHTLDVLYSAATNKQFITMQTKSGNTFYLVIDYDKPIDEDAEMYETHFLNLVDERDLLSLMSEEEMPTATPQVIYVTPEPTTPPAPTPVPTTAPVETEKPTEKQEKNPVLGIVALVLIVAVGGGAAFYFLKGKGKKSGAPASSGYDFDDDDEEEDEPEEESDSEK